MNDVAHRGAGGGCDNADVKGRFGQGLFALGGKQPLGGQLGLKLLVGQMQRPQPVGLHAGEIELILPVAFKDGHPALHNDLHAVFGPEKQLFGAGGKHHGAHRAFFVLERHVKVAALGVVFEVGELAAHHDVRQQGLIVQQGLDNGVELGDGENVALPSRLPVHA